MRKKKDTKAPKLQNEKKKVPKKKKKKRFPKKKKRQRICKKKLLASKVAPQRHLI